MSASQSGRTISLVLGSGGARGLAHIGVIDALVEAGYEIRAISGCSMGALVGGVYAMNKLDDTQIEDLPIRFTAVATDLDSLQEIWRRTRQSLSGRYAPLNPYRGGESIKTT